MPANSLWIDLRRLLEPLPVSANAVACEFFNIVGCDSTSVGIADALSAAEDDDGLLIVESTN